MFCSNCGYNHGGNGKFCPSCGGPINNVNKVTNNNEVMSQLLESQNTSKPIAFNEEIIIPTISQAPVNHPLSSNQESMSVVQPNTQINMQMPSYANSTNVNNNMNINYNNVPKKKSSALIIVIVICVLALLLTFCFLVLKNENRDYVEGTRTVMIYMVGSDLESENRIASSDIASILPSEMDLENVNVLLYTGGTSKWHNFVSNEENAIYVLKESGFEKIKTYGKENMGNSKTLSTFLNYAYDNYVTEHYDLILYNHGGAIDGAVYDDFTKDRLSLTDFKEALKDSPFNKNNKLELVLFRTCLNGTIEIADVFNEYADYLIASSEITFGSSMTPVLGFLTEIGPEDNAITFGEKFIEEYKGQMAIVDPTSEMGQLYAIVDLSKIDNIISLLNEFFAGLDLNEDYASVVRVRSGMLQFAYTYFNQSSYDMVDLYELVDGLSAYSNVDATNLLNAIEEAVIYSWSSINDVHGLSIYFPYNGNLQYQVYFLDMYDEFNFSNAYYAFINDFAALSRSNQGSSLGINSLVNSEINVINGTFSLKLSDEQLKDYATSGYVIFHKDNESFTPIITSDDMNLSDDGVLTPNFADKAIKVYDEKEEGYVQLIEKNINGLKTYYSSNVTLTNREDDSQINSAATVYFTFEDNKVNVTNVLLTGDEIAKGAVADLDNYTHIQFWNLKYNILDKEGNMNSGWDSSTTESGFEFETDGNYDFKVANLKDGNYYFVFFIKDIYGNVSYTKLLNMK